MIDKDKDSIWDGIDGSYENDVFVDESEVDSLRFSDQDLGGVTAPSVGTVAMTSLVRTISTGPLWTAIPVESQAAKITSPLVRRSVVPQRLTVA